LFIVIVYELSGLKLNEYNFGLSGPIAYSGIGGSNVDEQSPVAQIDGVPRILGNFMRTGCLTQKAWTLKLWISRDTMLPFDS
jgi:hypothetical protein